MNVVCQSVLVQLLLSTKETIFYLENGSIREVRTRYALFWDFTQRRLVVCYGHFGTTYLYHLQGSSNPKQNVRHLWLTTVVKTHSPKCSCALRLSIIFCCAVSDYSCAHTALHVCRDMQHFYKNKIYCFIIKQLCWAVFFINLLKPSGNFTYHQV
jgi:hypothetical protein